MRETWVQPLGWEDPLEEDMATHSSILAWRIPMDRRAWQGPQSMGSQRVGHDWVTKHTHTRASGSLLTEPGAGESPQVICQQIPLGQLGVLIRCWGERGLGGGEPETFQVWPKSGSPVSTYIYHFCFATGSWQENSKVSGKESLLFMRLAKCLQPLVFGVSPKPPGQASLNPGLRSERGGGGVWLWNIKLPGLFFFSSSFLTSIPTSSLGVFPLLRFLKFPFFYSTYQHVNSTRGWKGRRLRQTATAGINCLLKRLS